MNKFIGVFFFLCVIVVSNMAMALTVPLNVDNNGNILTDSSQIVDVTYAGNGSGGWLVTVGTGLNFEAFYFNFNQPIGSGDISISTAGWSLVTAGGGTAGNFGQFNVKLDGPVSGGTADLQFEVIAAGLFVPNSDSNTFAAKISSQQGGNAGGFVANGAISAVSLPSPTRLLLSAFTCFVVVSHLSRKRNCELSKPSRERTIIAPTHIAVNSHARRRRLWLQG